MSQLGATPKTPKPQNPKTPLYEKIRETDINKKRVKGNDEEGQLWKHHLHQSYDLAEDYQKTLSQSSSLPHTLSSFFFYWLSCAFLTDPRACQP